MWSTPSFAHNTTPFSPSFRSDGTDWEGFSSVFPLPPSPSASKSAAAASPIGSRSYVSSTEHFLPSFMEGQWAPSEAGVALNTPPSNVGSPSAEKNTPKIEEEISSQNLYKTELCRSFEETGACRYGPKCQFAHGKAELRPVLRHPKYKTQICKTFYSRGTCPYGRRCRFIHSVPGADAADLSSGRKNSPAPGSSVTPASPVGEYVPFSTLHSFSPSSPYTQATGSVGFGAVLTPERPFVAPMDSFFQGQANSHSFAPWITKPAGGWANASSMSQVSEPFQLITPTSSTPYPPATERDERDRLAFFERI